MTANLKITIPSDLNLISPLRQFVAQVLREHGFDEEAVHDVEIALSEALTNVIEHNYQLTGSYRLDVTCIIARDKCTIEVHDEGRAFDPTTVEVPPIQEQRTKRDYHLGMMYIRRCVDELHYTAIPGGNTLTMVKYRSAAKARLSRND